MGILERRRKRSATELWDLLERIVLDGDTRGTVTIRVEDVACLISDRAQLVRRLEAVRPWEN